MAQIVKSGKAIRLESASPLEKRRELRPWREKGFRVPDPDGQTVWHEKEAIKQIVLRAFFDCEADVFLFGSQVSGKTGRGSDYDVGYWCETAVSAAERAQLTEALEELPIPAHVELVDFQQVPEEFRKLVIETGAVELWKKRSKNSIFT